MELLIVVGISAALTVVGGLVLFRYSDSHNLENTAIEIVALLRNVQNRSLSRQDGNSDGQGDRWGVRFENGVEDSVKIFSGLSYSAERVATIYILRRGLKFNIPAEGVTRDIVFSSISGLPDISFTAKISLDGNSAVYVVISAIKENGKIEYQTYF